MRNFVITVNGTTYQVGVEEVGATTAAPVAVPAPQAVAPVAAPAPQAAAAPAPASQAAAPKAAVKPVANGEKVLSPFPGLIKNLLVAEGASVKKDQPILVLEAMKMDNDITAPCDGVVSFQVAKGANVESDAVLAVIG
jgi:biotin carboxyl carrier protein